MATSALYYLSHQISTKGDLDENIRNLHMIANKMLDKGHIVVNPAALIEHTGMNDQQDRDKIMNLCLQAVKACDGLIVCSDISMGVAKEIIVAQAHGIPVYQLEVFLPELFIRMYKVN